MGYSPPFVYGDAVDQFFCFVSVALESSLWCRRPSRVSLDDFCHHIFDQSSVFFTESVPSIDNFRWMTENWVGRWHVCRLDELVCLAVKRSSFNDVIKKAHCFPESVDWSDR